MDIDTTNKFIVGARGPDIVIMNPPRGPLTISEALLLAAYLVVMAGDDALWDATREAVENT